MNFTKHYTINTTTTQRQLLFAEIGDKGQLFWSSAGLYCRKLEGWLKTTGLRVEADYSDIHMREKIKRFETKKVPYMLVVGDKDIEQNGFSVRSRKEGNLGLMTIETLIDYIKEDIDQGKAKYLYE